ncbi:helix-turn-helix transcriptional regulator [Anaerorhabdus sp.]|uniref:helix-turn-helix transcriptional regulator n=1 Tax=Anaerorhabdus sp. TaxID=1872524 RepID=UPI003FA54600
MQKTIEIIEQHLDIEFLSSEAALSPFYYQKLFKKLVKLSVMDYIKGRRLSIALEDLKTTNKKIINVALDHRFNSHENFIKCFKETFILLQKTIEKIQAQ